MKIRPATLEDASVIASLIGELGYPCEDEQIRGRLPKVFESGDKIFLAEIDDQIGGMICYSSRARLSSDQEVGRITAMVVHSRLRRKGIGRALVQFVEDYARKNNHAAIELTTRLDRREAHEFYSNLDFKETSKKFEKRV